MRKAHNIIEDIVRRHLDQLLKARPDICSCKRCRDDIFALALNKVPARYVTSEAGAMHTLIAQVAVEESAVLLREVLCAIKVISANPRHDTHQDSDNAYALLIEQIKRDRGVDFSGYREGVLRRRIAVRMREHKLSSFSEYLQLLTHRDEEYEKLFDVLTINVSSFFRDMPVWDKLNATVLPELIQRRAQATDRRCLRVWSAGCSHGEEAHSLAIALYELLEHHTAGVTAEIHGTDIDKTCLQQARTGRFSRDVLRNVNAVRFKRFFLPIGDVFVVVPHVRRLVSFSERNLVHEAGLADMDLVVCRNVFIYFNRSLQEQLIMKFYRALVDGGYFVMGNSETLLGEARELFEEIDGPCRIFRKRSSSGPAL